MAAIGSTWQSGSWVSSSVWADGAWSAEAWGDNVWGESGWVTGSWADIPSPPSPQPPDDGGGSHAQSLWEVDRDTIILREDDELIEIIIALLEGLD